jgi:hypothetical protein
VRDKGRSERALLREKESVREKLARGVDAPKNIYLSIILKGKQILIALETIF